ncbi:MAG TPA: ABC transporter permease, partial [Acidobacteriaceae bacterium]|nr:ABC transporter permease [Acidobacteriaceae bacterium]
MGWTKRITNLFRRDRMDAEIAEELAAHIELAVEEATRRGVAEADARRAARLRFGNPVAVREKTAGTDLALGLESLTRDVRFALRQMRRSPGFAIAAVLTLALGIGANTAIFSLVEGILLRPLPYRHPDRLVVVWQTTPEHRATGAFFNTYRQFEAFQQNSRTFERLSAMSWASGMRSGPVQWNGRPVEMLAFSASMDFFSTLGVSAQIGRTFAPADLNAACTVVLAHGFWQNKLGAPANIAGQTLSFGDASCRVIGVMPRSFSFYPPETNAWMLITPSSTFATKPWESMTGVFGLLKPGVTREAAQAELASIEARILPEAPQEDVFLRNWAPDVIPLHDNFTWLTGRNLRRGLWLLLGASSLILLLACANLGSLLQGRSMGRSRELAMRAALGAGNGRLIGQLMTESLLLAASGTVAGLALSSGLLRWFRATNPIQLPPGTVIAMDWHVLLFAAAAGLVCLLLFGLLPARQASRMDPNAALRAGGAAQGATRSALHAMQGLVVMQVALSMMLMATAGLLAKSLWNLVATDVGYRTEHIFSAQIYLPKGRYVRKGDLSRLTVQVQPDVAALPRVESVAFTSRYLPMGGSNTLAIEGRHTPENNPPTAVEQDVSSLYFATLNIPVLRGRGFDGRDQENTQPVAMINEALATRYFPGMDPIGHAIQLVSEHNAARWLTIVGITADVKTTTVFQEMGYVENPVVYRPLAQAAPASLALVAATSGPAGDLAG